MIYSPEDTTYVLYIQFNSIQNCLFSTQHIVNTTMFSCMRRVENGTSRRQRLCGLVPYLNNILIYNTQLLIGDNDLNNHNDNVVAMLLQSCKHKKTRNSCRIIYTSKVASKLKYFKYFFRLFLNIITLLHSLKLVDKESKCREQ